MARRIVKALDEKNNIKSKGYDYKGFVADVYKWVKENYGNDAGKRLDYFDKTAREWFDHGVTIEEAKEYIMENFKIESAYKEKPSEEIGQEEREMDITINTDFTNKFIELYGSEIPNLEEYKKNDISDTLPGAQTIYSFNIGDINKSHLRSTGLGMLWLKTEIWRPGIRTLEDGTTEYGRTYTISLEIKGERRAKGGRTWWKDAIVVQFHDFSEDMDEVLKKFGNWLSTNPFENIKNIEAKNNIIAFDFTMNQDLNIGDKVNFGNEREGIIYQITRVHDIYENEEDFNNTQETYGNTGLSWEGNEIMTVHIADIPDYENKENWINDVYEGSGREKFIYEIEKKGKDLSDVQMPPQKGSTLGSKLSKDANEYISNKIKYLMEEEGMKQDQAIAIAYKYAKKEGYDVPEKKKTKANENIIKIDMDLEETTGLTGEDDIKWKYYATVLNVGNETIQLINHDTGKKWRVLPEDLYEDIDTGILRIKANKKTLGRKENITPQEYADEIFNHIMNYEPLYNSYLETGYIVVKNKIDKYGYTAEQLLSYQESPVRWRKLIGDISSDLEVEYGKLDKTTYDLIRKDLWESFKEDYKWYAEKQDKIKQSENEMIVQSSKNNIKADEIRKSWRAGSRNGMADVMVELIFGGDYKSAYESLVRQMSDDEFFSGYEYIKRMNYNGEEEDLKTLEEAEKEFQS
jgi:hypothetical protein